MKPATSRILFVDDDTERHQAFGHRSPDETLIVHAYTVVEAVMHIENLPRFNVWYLDHDFDLTVPEHRQSGQAFCVWAATECPAEKLPDRVVIHSVNEEGAAAMAKIIGWLGLPCTIEPFNHTKETP